MELKTFLLDLWLEEHEHAARYNLAASTGPSWTVEDLLGLMNEDENERFLKTPLTYCPGTGHASLRGEIAAMYGALLSMFYLAAEDGKNVVVPSPAFPPFFDIPEGLGLEVRSFELRFEDGFEVDVDAIKGLVDQNTELILVNSPHNPTGATMSPDELRTLSSFAKEHGVSTRSTTLFIAQRRHLPQGSISTPPFLAIFRRLSASPASGLDGSWSATRKDAKPIGTRAHISASRTICLERFSPRWPPATGRRSSIAFA